MGAEHAEITSPRVSRATVHDAVAAIDTSGPDGAIVVAPNAVSVRSACGVRVRRCVAHIARETELGTAARGGLGRILLLDCGVLRKNDYLAWTRLPSARRWPLRTLGSENGTVVKDQSP